MSLTNEALAERIEGLGKLVTEQVGGVRREVQALATNVGVQNGRIGALEVAKIQADQERVTLKDVATTDRQHNLDVEQSSWSTWQKVLGVFGVMCAGLAGTGGLIEMLQHI